MDNNVGHFSNFENVEVLRLRYTIAKFKEYDAKRKRYVAHLERLVEKYRARIKELEKLTERQHNEIDELINSYETARPLISNPEQKAYVFELVEKIGKLRDERTQLKCENQQLREQLKMNHNELPE